MYMYNCTHLATNYLHSCQSSDNFAFPPAGLPPLIETPDKKTERETRERNTPYDNALDPFKGCRDGGEVKGCRGNPSIKRRDVTHLLESIEINGDGVLTVTLH